MKTATFFGGAVREITPEYNDSVKIGELLSKSGFNIKNGGYFGLMEAVSKGAHNNSVVTGYTCKTFPSTLGNEYLTQYFICDDIYDRLRCLINDTDLFIVQNGGIGTLSELFLTLDVIRKHKVKPDIFLFGELYVNLFEPIKHLLDKKITEKLHFCKDFSDFESQFQLLISL